MIGQARGSKREIFKYHDSAERVLFSDLRNSLLSVVIKMRVIVGDSDSEGVCPSGQSALLMMKVSGPCLRPHSHFPVLRPPGDPALRPAEFCSLPVPLVTELKRCKVN